MQLLLPVIRSDFEMHETYVYQPSAPLDCLISAFGGLQDPHVTEADLCAWRDQTTSDFRLKMFPGDHFFLHTSAKSILLQISDGLGAFAGPGEGQLQNGGTLNLGSPPRSCESLSGVSSPVRV